MKTIKIIIMVLSLTVIYQFSNAQNCQGNKVLMSYGYKGACGCRCQKQCVDQSEVQNYINMGWYLGECINVGKLCCGGWLRRNEPSENTDAWLADIHADPSSMTVDISFNLSKQSEVNLQVFDMAGRCVATVAKQVFNENGNVVTWNTSGVTPGIYLLKMNADEYRVTKKIIVLN